MLRSKMINYYQNAHDCSAILYQEGQKLSSRYCNCRTCLTCNGIRTANYIRGYGEQILNLADPQFVTLTAPTVECFDVETLRYFIDARESIWRKICENARKNGNGLIKLVGLKAMEVTARPDNHYHIHFHFIIEGNDNAQWVKKQWLSHYKSAEHYLQVIKPLNSAEALLEVFKYGTKFFDKEKKIVNGKVITVHKSVEPERTDLIIQAMYKKRLISTFGGIRRVKDEDVNDIVQQTIIPNLEYVESDRWKWLDGVDWFSHARGDKFSSFVPSPEFKKVFAKDLKTQ
jgi:hypothetical protein